MNWTKVTVLTTTEAADIVSEILMELGSQGTMIEDRKDVFDNQRPAGQWDIIDEAIAERIGPDVKVTGFYAPEESREGLTAALKDRLEVFHREAGGMPVGSLAVLADDLPEEDWSESWKAGYHPIRLGEHFVVKAGWMDAEILPDDRVIEIDPGLAFGSGTHETTGMCAALVERWVKRGDRVIDIGTGSGILAIAAAKMGARRVLATDLDPVAARVAAENAAANGCGGVVETRCGDLLDVVDEQAEVVVANIIADVIIGLARPVRQCVRDGGVFICSGILTSRRDDVKKALLDANFEILDAPVKGEWAAFAARKR